MQPDTGKLWTRPEVRASIGKILLESLGVDEGAVVDGAALVRDLGAESIDFLDISFKCQQTFGVDVPARLIQDRVVEWRDLRVLAAVVGERYGLEVSAEELRTIAPAALPAVLRHLAAKHGLAPATGEDEALALALARRLLANLDGLGLDLADLPPRALAVHLMENLHSPAAMAQIMDRFTVAALTSYIVGRLGQAGRLANGA